jgi:predicted HTH domain antitoxin
MSEQRDVQLFLNDIYIKPEERDIIDRAARMRGKNRTDFIKEIDMPLIIEYPTCLPDALQSSREDFEQEAKMAMAVKLFERRRISSGQAAKLVGIGRVSFLLQLHRYGVSMIDLNQEELESDIKNA